MQSEDENKMGLLILKLPPPLTASTPAFYAAVWPAMAPLLAFPLPLLLALKHVKLHLKQ